MHLTINDIIAATGGVFYGEETGLGEELAGVVIDSRQVRPGFLYIPIRGERVDGHTFIPDVFAKGAALVLSELVFTNPAGPYVLVQDTPQALKDIAAYYRRTLTIPIVGITGSVGKTSTKEMIAAVLAEKFCVLKTEGNFNNEIGLPLTLLRINEEHQVAVVEMGISDFGEMHRLADMARPNIVVMTNIGQCHLENLKDRDGVLQAKSEIFDFLKEDGKIVLNGNDDKLATIENVNGIVPMRYIVEEDATKAGKSCPPLRAERATGEGDRAKHGGGVPPFVVASNIKNHGLAGMEAQLRFADGEILPIKEPIPGVHSIYNACAAACVGEALGLTRQELARGIAKAKTIAGRTNLVNAGGVTFIDDCYNANPVSMKAALDVLCKAEGRKIAVLGDMGELGAREVALHAEVGAYAAEVGIDALYCTGTLSKALFDAAKGGVAADWFENREALLLALEKDIKKGDTVLIKASHFMQFSKIVEALVKHFS